MSAPLAGRASARGGARRGVGHAARLGRLATVLVPALATLLVYGRALDFALFNDDPSGNLRWVVGRPLPTLLWSAEGHPYFRPLASLVWRATHDALGRFDPLAYHVVSLATQAGAAVLVALALERITGRRWLAQLAALLFVLQPFNFEAAYVGALVHPLATLFAVATLALHGRSSLAGRPLWRWLAGLLTFSLALMAHESAVVLLPLLVAHDLLFARLPARWSFQLVRPYLPYGLLTIGYLVLWQMAPKLPATETRLRPPAEMASSALYLFQALAYPVAPFGTPLAAALGLPAAAPAITVGLGLVALATLLLAARRSGLARLYLFGLAWATLATAPAVLLLPWSYVSGSPRLFYLGSVGAAACWAAGLAALLPRARLAVAPRERLLRLAAGLALLAAIGGPAFFFVQGRLDQMATGSRLVRAVADTAARAPADARVLYLNLPAYAGPGTTDYPIGYLGTTLFPAYLHLPDVVLVHANVQREVEAYVSPELQARPYFTFGQGKPLPEIALRWLYADRGYRFDPDSWSLVDLDLDAGTPQLDLPRLARRAGARGVRVYQGAPRGDDLALRLPRSSRSPAPFDARCALVLPPPGEEALYLFQHDDQAAQRWLAELVPNAALAGTDGAAGLAALSVPAGAPADFDRYRTVRVTLGQQIRLLGVAVDPGPVAPGGTVELQLVWQQIGASQLDRDYTVFVHLLGPTNPRDGSPLWGQRDGQPGCGSYPTSAWRPGETVVERVVLPVEPSAPPGPYLLEVGMYLLATGQRLAMTDPEGQRLAHDRLLIAGPDVQP